MLSKSVTFCLDARADLSPEEAQSVRKYGLGSQVLYNSTAAKGHLDKVAETASGSRGFLSGAVSLAMAKMSLSITIDSLTKGHHIECKDLDEMLGAEEAIKSACDNIRAYLDIASTFDGREIVLDINRVEAA